MLICERLNVYNIYLLASATACADPEVGEWARWSGPHPRREKTQSYRVSQQYWSGCPGKSQSYQASIYCWAIIGNAWY